MSLEHETSSSWRVSRVFVAIASGAAVAVAVPVLGGCALPSGLDAEADGSAGAGGEGWISEAGDAGDALADASSRDAPLGSRVDAGRDAARESGDDAGSDAVVAGLQDGTDGAPVPGCPHAVPPGATTCCGRMPCVERQGNSCNCSECHVCAVMCCFGSQGTLSCVATPADCQ
jgi:hypothetical protein